MLLKNEKGVSMVEIIASIVLISIILIGFMSLFPTMGKTNNQNEDRIEAINLAKRELIEWQNYFQNNANYTNFTNFVNNPTASYTLFNGLSLSLNNNFTFTTNQIDISDIPLRTLSGTNKTINMTINRNEVISGNKDAYTIHLKIMNGTTLESETFGYVFVPGGI